jgi:spore coat polysaccharide biosynthesis predicted glycosyltransferase SpsG
VVLNNLNVIIFTEFSKKKGLGHYVRSRRLYHYLKKKYLVKLYVNKNSSFINKVINSNKKKTIYFFDFKNYKKKQYYSKSFGCFNIFLDKVSGGKKNCININPLIPSNSNYSGPRWFFYPLEFFQKLKKKKNKLKRVLICQGGTDANNNICKLIKIIKNKIKDCKFHLSVLAPKNYKLNKNLKKKYSIKFYSNINNMHFFLNKFDHIVSSCGSIGYEINFFGINCTFVTTEPREIKLAKHFKKKRFANFFDISEKKNILKDIYSQLISKNDNKLLKKKTNYFRHNGLLNTENLILKIIKKNEI